MVFIVLVVLLSPQCILGNSISILSKLTPLDYYGQLFAVIGGSSCAETLAYGPLSVTQSGASGYPLFFSTQLSSFVHSRWLEIEPQMEQLSYFEYIGNLIPREL